MGGLACSSILSQPAARQEPRYLAASQLALTRRVGKNKRTVLDCLLNRLAFRDVCRQHPLTSDLPSNNSHMPNWNYNCVKIHANRDAVKAWLIPIKEDEYRFNMHKLFPEAVPEGDPT